MEKNPKLKMIIEIDVNEKTKRFLDVYVNPYEVIEKMLMNQEMILGKISNVQNIEYIMHTTVKE